MLGPMARRFGWSRLIGGALLALLLAIRFVDPLAVQLTRLTVFDLYQTAKPRIAEQHPIVIVDIDEASLDKLGQWPWPRNVVAELVKKLSAKGAVAIAFDVLFPEPDRTSPQLIAKDIPNLSEAARAEIEAARNHDEILSDAIAASRVVVAQSAYAQRTVSTRTSSIAQAPIATIGADPKPFLLRYPDLVPNIEILEKAAKGRGMVTILPDPDGIVRKVPTVLIAKDKIVPSLTMELLRVATGQSTFLVKSNEAGVQNVVVAGAQIPTDGFGQFWVHFTDRDQRRYVSAKDVMDGTVPTERIANKLVLIGTSALGLFDLKATPLDPAMPGVEVHAQVLENILTQSGLLRPAYASGAELSLALAVGLLFIILAPIVGPTTIFLVGATLATVMIGTSWYLYTESKLLVDVAFPLVSSFIVFLAMLSFNYFRGEAERRQVRDAFGQYLSPALVEQLAEDPDKLVLGGETRNMTFLFSDVRGFTTISEQYREDPQSLTRLMNRFLTPLSNAIIERNGTIDKYMGDSIMAFWNAPIDHEKHALSACEAALDMLQHIDDINAARKSEADEAGQAFMPLDMGVGINTGECVVGNMGSDLRFDYTVLGDSVNLASRLEGQSRVYGVPVIIGSQTAQQVRSEFATIEIDAIRVKGKTEPEIIHTILGRRDVLSDPAYRELRGLMSDVLSAYRSQDWDGTLRAVEACCDRANGFGLGGLLEIYRDRVATFRSAPPPLDWDGVFTADAK